MSELERIEREAEQAGREDRLRELAREADIANDADLDHEEIFEQARREALSPEERATEDRLRALQRSEEEAAARRALRESSDDLPF